MSVFAAIRRQHRHHCPPLFSSALARGRLGYASPAASPPQRSPMERPTLPPSPPPRARGGSRYAPSGRGAGCRPPDRGVTGGVCLGLPPASYPCFAVVLWRSGVCNTIARFILAPCPPLRVVGLVALLRPRSGAPVRPTGRAVRGLRPPFFSAVAPTVARPSGGFPVRAARARVFPARLVGRTPASLTPSLCALRARTSGAKLPPRPPTAR